MMISYMNPCPVDRRGSKASTLSAPQLPVRPEIKDVWAGSMISRRGGVKKPVYAMGCACFGKSFKSNTPQSAKGLFLH